MKVNLYKLHFLSLHFSILSPFSILPLFYPSNQMNPLGYNISDKQTHNIFDTLLET